MRGARTMIVGAFVVALTVAPTAASACTEQGTDMSQATTNGIPVVEQQVLASPMEGWPGDRAAFQVWDDGAGRVELVVIVDAPGGLTEGQAAQLTQALGEPVVTSPSTWDHIRSTAWAWWPHLAILALLVLVFGTLFDALQRIARRVGRARDRRRGVAST